MPILEDSASNSPYRAPVIEAQGPGGELEIFLLSHGGAPF